MKVLLTTIVAAGLTLSGAALAQTSGTASTAPAAGAAANTSASSNSGSMSQKSLASAQKLQQDLKNAGFKDVNIVAESFVVQAKTKDGDPILMTIGPHGMTVFEAMNAGSASSTASNSSAAAGNSKPAAQK